jgi:hypothetical protein
VNEVLGTFPEPSVLTRLFRGFVQLTGTWLPKTPIVGCGVALLHSMMDPVELAVNPLPDTITLPPSVRLV